MDAEQDRLSHREEEILLLASEGLTDKEIAGHLGVQISTVRTYWDRLKVKLSANNRTEAVARLLRHGALDALPLNIVGAIPHLLMVVDPGGLVEFMNPKAQEYFAPAEIRRWECLVHPEDADILGCREGIAIVRCLRRDGVYRKHVVTQSPLEIREGGVSKWIRSAVDVEDLSLRNGTSKADTFDKT